MPDTSRLTAREVAALDQIEAAMRAPAPRPRRALGAAAATFLAFLLAPASVLLFVGAVTSRSQALSWLAVAAWLATIALASHAQDHARLTAPLHL
ncbi:hypothetical protein [Streptomyces sp. NPDC002990]